MPADHTPRLEPLVVDLNEAAGALGVSLSTVRTLIREKRLPAVTLRRRTMVRVEELRNYAATLPPAGSEAA